MRHCAALLLLPLLLASLPTRADDAGVATIPDVVRVTGVRAIPWKSYRAMRAALAAHEKYKHLAPDADFSFGVIPPDGQKTLPPNFALRVRTADGKEYPIALNGKLFQLPDLPADVRDADLVTNLKGAHIRIGIHVESPGVSLVTDRLGDTRLYCQISDAMERSDQDWLTRRLRPNPCEDPDIPYWTVLSSATRTNGAYVIDGLRSMALPRRDENGVTSYRLPVADANWGNDTLIRFDYVEPPPARNAGQRLRYDAKD